MMPFNQELSCILAGIPRSQGLATRTIDRYHADRKIAMKSGEMSIPYMVMLPGPDSTLHFHLLRKIIVWNTEKTR